MITAKQFFIKFPKNETNKNLVSHLTFYKCKKNKIIQNFQKGLNFKKKTKKLKFALISEA